MNKKRPKQLSAIKIKDFELSDASPTLSNFRLVNCCDKVDEVVIDVDVLYKGLIRFVLNTTYTPIETSVVGVSFKKQFNMDLTIKITEIVCILRVCLHPYALGKPWWIN